MLMLVFDAPEDKDKFVHIYETYGKTIYCTLGRYNLELKYQKKKEEKKEEPVRKPRRSRAGRKYARSLQCHAPGIEAHSMKWMREMPERQLCSSTFGVFLVSFLSTGSSLQEELFSLRFAPETRQFGISGCDFSESRIM